MRRSPSDPFSFPLSVHTFIKREIALSLWLRKNCIFVKEDLWWEVSLIHVKTVFGNIMRME